MNLNKQQSAEQIKASVTARISKLQDSPQTFESIVMGTTQINISGKLVDVKVFRNKNGNLAIDIIDNDQYKAGGWLSEGTCTEGFHGNDGIECILTAYRYNQ